MVYIKYHLYCFRLGIKMEFTDGKVGAYEVGGTHIYIDDAGIRFNELLNGACLFKGDKASFSITPGQLVVAMPKVAAIMENDATRLVLAQVLEDPAKSDQIIGKYLISMISKKDAGGIVALIAPELYMSKAAISYGDYWVNTREILNPSNHFVIADTEDDARVMMDKRLAALQPPKTNHG